MPRLTGSLTALFWLLKEIGLQYAAGCDQDDPHPNAVVLFLPIASPVHLPAVITCLLSPLLSPVTEGALSVASVTAS